MSEYENAHKRQNAIKFANLIVVDFLKDYIPKACSYEAIRNLEFKLLETDLYIMDDQTKARLKYYEETILKMGNLESLSIIKKDA